MPITTSDTEGSVSLSCRILQFIKRVNGWFLSSELIVWSCIVLSYPSSEATGEGVDPCKLHKLTSVLLSNKSCSLLSCPFCQSRNFGFSSCKLSSVPLFSKSCKVLLLSSSCLFFHLILPALISLSDLEYFFILFVFSSEIIKYWKDQHLCEGCLAESLIYCVVLDV